MPSDYAPFQETTLRAGCWCSRDDACLVIADLSGILRDDADLLDGCIRRATDRAKSILRSRWSSTWPFTSPPDELREAVAVMAVCRAVRQRVYAGGAIEGDRVRIPASLVTRKWLKSIADSEAHFDLPEVIGGSGPSVTPAPAGEFGFK